MEPRDIRYTRSGEVDIATDLQDSDLPKVEDLGDQVSAIQSLTYEFLRPNWSDIDDVDTITASVANIVFDCRAVQSGVLSTVDEEALGRDVGALLAVAESRDPDVEQDCSPEDARRLREAVGD